MKVKGWEQVPPDSVRWDMKVGDLMLAVGCAANLTAMNETTGTEKRDLWADEARAEARRDLAQAIRTQELYICDTGTIVLYSPGVPPDKKGVLRGIPHRVLASGCTDPAVHRNIVYAEAFNRQLLNYLEGRAAAH